MKSKNLLFILFLFLNYTGLIAQSKEAEILLVGVIHEIPEASKCNWQKTYQKILKYKPDQIAVEYVPPGDSASLKYYLPKNYLPVWDSVMIRWVGKKVNPADSVEYYFQLLNKTNNIHTRLKLWEFYHLNTDMGNRDFQSYLITHESEKALSIPDTSAVWMKGFYSRHKAVIESRKNGEFFNLVYPLAKALKINYLHPTDYKATYGEQSSAYQTFADTLQKLPAWKSYMKFWEDFNVEANKHIVSCNALEYTNTKHYLEQSDYGQARYFANLSNAAFDAFAKVWYKRNEIIAGRIISAIKTSSARRMAVFYGNMHIYPLKMFLEKQGYKVLLLEDIKN